MTNEKLNTKGIKDTGTKGTTKGTKTKPKGKETTIQIPSNGITSGKTELSIFNLTFQKKRITTPFFPILTGKPEYDYDHHIDGERLQTLGDRHKDIPFFSYEKRGETENYKHITIQSYGDLMKYNLYLLISQGKLTKTIEHETGDKTTYLMTWTGEPLTPPTLKTKEPKEPKNKKTPNTELEGLNFF